ncbi:hypothetical protein L596_030490 [Steinernema carpocapsae]|uniref:Zinc metalloproteinase n=1 Tax=Steinernema carpocapsae TaxID=34508 RepID=A0A4U5LPL3_STECR|nr:hypothetical protein L596_030490 [Steinernema carpocapsae]
MLKSLVLLGFVGFGLSVRFYDLISDGESTFHGIPVKKYVDSMNRLIEMAQKLLEQKHVPSTSFENIDWDRNATSLEMNPFLYQGDLTMTEEMLDALVEDFEIQLAEKEGRHIPDRLYSMGVNLWRNFPINWSIDNRRPPNGGIQAVRRGIALWEQATCLTFQEGNNWSNGGMVFYNGGGCFSPMGKNRGSNWVSIGPGCGTSAIVAHEIGHSLGLFHTQTRPDAQSYVNIFWNNIQKTMQYNYFPPKAWDRATTRGISYDLGSVMHYGRVGFPINYNQPTMLPKNRNYYQTMGQRSHLAFTDAKEVNLMYCDVCSNKLPCTNGGYTDPKDCSKCRCPDGLGGKLCDSVASSPKQCGSQFLFAWKEFETLEMSGQISCDFMIMGSHGIELYLDWTKFGGGDFENACQFNYVELKYTKNKEVAGARFCPYKSQSPVVIPPSQSSDKVYVLFRSQNPSYGFSLRYREIPFATIEPPTTTPKPLTTTVSTTLKPQGTTILFTTTTKPTATVQPTTTNKPDATAVTNTPETATKAPTTTTTTPTTICRTHNDPYSMGSLEHVPIRLWRLWKASHDELLPQKVGVAQLQL